MTPGRLLGALSVPLMLLVAACTSAGLDPAFGAEPRPVPCNALLIDAANYADDLAGKRDEQMMVMRFGSEAAMNVYTGTTQRLRTEALRMTERLQAIMERHGGQPDYARRLFGSLTVEEANARIAAADACADEALK